MLLVLIIFTNSKFYLFIGFSLGEKSPTVRGMHETENSPFQAAEKRLILLSPCLFWNSPPQTRLDRFLSFSMWPAPETYENGGPWFKSVRLM